MIPTSSKYLYALATTLLVAAVVYGYATGGGEVGPISVGYKGAVGDVFGYTVLLGAAGVAAFLGFATTAFRDADPEASAARLGLPPEADVLAGRVPVPGTSYWPVVGAFGVGLTVVGAVLNNVFFVAGLIALGAVAFEWTIQAWSDRATGDPAVNREIRNRLMLPLEVPIAGALIVGVVILGFSRVFLAASAEGAVWIAIVLAAVVFAIGTILSTRDTVRADVIAGVLVIGAVVTIGLGIYGAVAGERDFEHHGDDHSDESDDHSDESDDHSSGGDDHTEDEGAAPLQESN